MPTPDEWRSDLEAELDEQTQAIQIYEDYYDGRHRMAFVTAKFREAFGEIFDTLVDNWCELVVDAPVERLAIEGFRFEADSEQAAKKAETDAWRIWKANRMPSQSIMGHSEAVKSGWSYVMVAPGEPPRITVEHPSQMIIRYAAGSRTERVAALKRWRGSDGRTYVTLYLPDSIHKWVSSKSSLATPSRDRNWLNRRLPMLSSAADSMEDREGSGANPLGVVPVWELPNNPTMLGGGRSDLLPAIPLQDAINKEVADMLIASEFAAFPQRVVMGVEVPMDEKGEPLPEVEMKAAISRLWTFEDPATKISEFTAADLSNYVNAITVLLQHLAAQTRTPPHYLLGQIVNASGDALKAAETGLVSKVKRKQLDFSDTWQDVMAAALKLNGTAQTGSVETVWRDPEFRSEGEMVDGAVKLKAIGIPFEALWERIGATPQQIEKWAVLMNLPERRSFGNPDDQTNNGAKPGLKERNAPDGRSDGTGNPGD